MTILEFNIEANADSPPRLTPSQGRPLLDEFINTYHFHTMELTYEPASFDPLFHQPIQHSFVSRTSTGIGEKPYYLAATILPKHVGCGEPTTAHPDLAELIRSRGRGPGQDECGHIIARKLGGKMLEFNLFPQDKKINRGWFGLNKWWRKGVEKVMEKWLSLPENINPVVEFEIILYYDDEAFPDRPNRAKLLIALKSDDEDDGDEQDNDGEKLLHPTLRGELLNELEIAEVDLRESVYERINWANFAEHFGNRYSLYALFLREVMEAIIIEVQTPPQVPVPLPVRPSPATVRSSCPPARGSNTPFSVLDLVPIVGDVRSIIQGVEDAEDGNVLGATANIAIGVGGLILCVCTLGALSSLAGGALKEGGKQVGKAVTKEIVKETGKELAKEGGKQVGKAVTRQIVKEVVKETAVIVCRVGAAAKFAGFVLQRVVS